MEHFFQTGFPNSDHSWVTALVVLLVSSVPRAHFVSSVKGHLVGKLYWRYQKHILTINDNTIIAEWHMGYICPMPN